MREGGQAHARGRSGGEEGEHTTGGSKKEEEREYIYIYMVCVCVCGCVCVCVCVCVEHSNLYLTNFKPILIYNDIYIYK